MVAISVDPPSESKQTDALLNGAFPLLQDAELKVIHTYGMEHSMGGMIYGNMGYVIIDRQGIVRSIAIDPSFGHHADTILDMLKTI